ncbi:HvfB family MNIO-type RiPP peptide maturase [Luteimonas sp. e5]
MTRALGAATVGLGLRRGLLGAIESEPAGDFDFLECAPENWIGVGGELGQRFAALSARLPITLHGLSLSLGGPQPLDSDLLDGIAGFMQRHAIDHYSEHLSWSGDDGHLYDLIPLPFDDASVRHVATRIDRVQQHLGRRIAVENISYYAAPWQRMSEVEFLLAVLDAADCDLLLDVNNIFVNSINHGYDADAFLAAMPSARIAGYHVAGHHDEADDLKIDTHGAAVKDAVWQLLASAYRRHGVRPTLLERDFNYPPYAELQAELQRIRVLQAEALAP